MIQYNRRNNIWLAIILAMSGIALVGGTAIAPTVQIALLAMVSIALVLSFVQLDRRQIPLISTIQGRANPVTVMRNSRVSAQAREAQNRAQSRGIPINPDLLMIDVGLIASSHGDDGMVMRRTRSISKDDDGVRPFVTLDIKPSEADRKARLRFEIIDQNGDEQYIHEMDVYLRDGELNILADHHLPLTGNSQIEGMGDWDLRVYLDGQLYGMHSFQLTPSDDERRSRLGGQRPRRYHIPEADESERPAHREPERESRRGDSRHSEPRNKSMTLEELLRDQDNQSSSRK